MTLHFAPIGGLPNLYTWMFLAIQQRSRRPMGPFL
jgi:hypothetical protein